MHHGHPLILFTMLTETSCEQRGQDAVLTAVSAHPLQAEKRAAELKKMGLKAKIVLIGKKGITYFNRRQTQYDIVGRSHCTFELHDILLHLPDRFWCNLLLLCTCST